MLRATVSFWLIVTSLAVGCGRSERRSEPTGAAADPEATPPPTATATPPDDAGPPADRCGDRRELAPGLVWQSVVASRPPAVDLGDRCIRLLRIDPRRYRLRALSGASEGIARPAPEWAEREQLIAVINASMYRPDLRSTGLLVTDGVVAGRDNPKFGAYLAFDPEDGDRDPVRLVGRGCPGVDLPALRAAYRSVVQSYRILDCDGAPIAWQDDKAYSSAAIAIDRDDRVVLVHLRTPYLMRDVAAMLAAPELGLTQAMFVEGGPEATLHVATPALTTTLVGSYETGFHEQDDNQAPWPLPNVIGVAPRGQDVDWAPRRPDLVTD